MLADVFAIILTVVVVTIRLMLLPIILLLLVGRCYISPDVDILNGR